MNNSSKKSIDESLCPCCGVEMELDAASHEVGITLEEAQRKTEDLGCWGYWKFDSLVFRQMVEEAGHGVELSMFVCLECDLRAIEINIP